MPKKIKHIIDNQIFSYKLSGKIFTWRKLQKCAMMVDSSRDDERTESESEEVIEVNLAETIKRHNNYNYKNNNNQNHNNTKSYKFQNRQQQDYNSKTDNNYQKSYGRTEGQVNWNKPPDTRTCHYCGRFGHKINECRKKLGTCFKCGHIGHMARECNTQRFQERRAQSMSPKQSNNSNYNKNYRNYSQNPVRHQSQLNF